MKRLAIFAFVAVLLTAAPASAGTFRAFRTRWFSTHLRTNAIPRPPVVDDLSASWGRWNYLWHRQWDRLRRAWYVALEREAEVRESRFMNHESWTMIHVPNPTPTGPIAALIYSIFGVYGPQAVAVASCESGLDVYAIGGTDNNYYGLFQMGPSERVKWGFAWDALIQIRAAFAYFSAAGWGPWSCRP